MAPPSRVSVQVRAGRYAGRVRTGNSAPGWHSALSAVGRTFGSSGALTASVTGVGTA